MKLPRNKSAFAVAALVAAGSLFAGGTSVPADAAAASISGKWRGNGVATLESGNKERVRCQVTYGRIAGQNFSLAARCASGAGRLNQVGQLTRVSSGKYVGDVVNQEYNIRARVSVTVRGNQQLVVIKSKQGSASLSLKRR